MRSMAKLLDSQEQVILAIDGLQPQVGHPVRWVIRDCISESILLARSLLSSRGEEIASMLFEVVEALPQIVSIMKSQLNLPGWLSVKTIIKIESQRQTRYKSESETRYYISDLIETASSFYQRIRGY